MPSKEESRRSFRVAKPNWCRSTSRVVDVVRQPSHELISAEQRSLDNISVGPSFDRSGVASLMSEVVCRQELALQVLHALLHQVGVHLHEGDRPK